MGFKQCSVCKGYYNDKLGGCKNPKCKPQPQTLPVVQPPTKVIPSVAKSFTLRLYRGEKSDWWPPPNKRLAGGMGPFAPWKVGSMTELWEKIKADIIKNGKGTVDGYAQYLRASGKSYALATARTKGGAFTGYNYVIDLKNVRTFYWSKSLDRGGPANFIKAAKVTKEVFVNGKTKVTIHDSVDNHYMVLNADTIAASTIFGFGHKTKTYEVTLFQTLPKEKVVTCDGKQLKDLSIMTKEEVNKLPDNDKNNIAKKLLL